MTAPKPLPEGCSAEVVAAYEAGRLKWNGSFFFCWRLDNKWSALADGQHGVYSVGVGHRGWVRVKGLPAALARLVAQ